MKTYDIIVIGSGAGNIVADEALRHNYSVALVDRGPLGGTCLNLGCIPSKMLLYPADRIMEIREAARLGIAARIESVDFSGIMERMRQAVSRDRADISRRLKEAPGLDVYEEEAGFTDEYSLIAGQEKIRGRKIVIAAGASPSVPPVEGLEETGFLTNESVLDLTQKPESLIIIGGGYIAAEYAHFFDAMGTRVTLLQRGDRLVKEEEPEISRLLEKKLAGRMALHTHAEAVWARREKNLCAVRCRFKKDGGEETFSAEKILVAAGRKSNAGPLGIEKTGVETDEKGYIVTDAVMKTTNENIWALGDITGRGMFRHAANYEAMVVSENIFHGANLEMDYLKVPHAVFTHPEIASVGLTEEAAIRKYGAGALLKGYAGYDETARGEAMMETDGFAKIIVHKERGTIAGCHIIGPHASILIQEVVNAMADENGLSLLLTSMHIHPALTEIVQDIFQNLEEIG